MQPSSDQYAEMVIRRSVDQSVKSLIDLVIANGAVEAGVFDNVKARQIIEQYSTTIRELALAEFPVERPQIDNRCKCGAPAGQYSCPYDAELKDKTTYCGCCSTCRNKCRDEV